MIKSPQAFRTISEVADHLDVPAHVLRFWETKFTQVKPVKRGGGRRYYRPEDVVLLEGIRDLLYSDGMTIKGVQKILRERGARHVAGLADAPAAEAASPEGAPHHAPAVAVTPIETDVAAGMARDIAPAAEPATEPATDRVHAVIAKLEVLRDRLRADPSLALTGGNA
ncbi:MAG: DNA-binding transcriptional MerR regulator [Paracoccaceae bacterium]|jgi:DNA-binding transcriptional MerR regulator